MEHLLYLAHRIPYPPNKGDKIRSFHLLRHLAERYRVHLGCFVDSEGDAIHAARLERWCEQVCAVPLNPRWGRGRSLFGLLTGEALTLPYYRNARLRSWVERTVAECGISKAVAFSSPMAQYLLPLPNVRTVVDLVDVDSAKWTSYADHHRWPTSRIYRREGERLLAFEREVAGKAAATVLVTPAEVQLFRRLAPECGERIHAIENGVDSDFYSPSAEFASPFPEGEMPVVFTGVMDYWPNADAVIWFAREVLPELVRRRGDVRFYVVGMNPTPAVTALAADSNVVVTGKVTDVRPFLQHAAVVVAPLRVARGVQNKILEAMSMGRPVVASASAAAAVAATPGIEIEAAQDKEDYVESLLRVLDPACGNAMGAHAASLIRSRYQWASALSRFSDLLGGMPVGEAVSTGGVRPRPVCAA